METTNAMTRALIKPRDYVVCKMVNGHPKPAEALLWGKTYKNIRVFTANGEYEIEALRKAHLIIHRDGTLETNFPRDGVRSVVDFEELDLEHYVDMFFENDENYDLFNKLFDEAKETTMTIDVSTTKNIKIPVWHFLNPDNKLGRKFKKNGRVEKDEDEFEFTFKDFNIKEFEGREIIVKGYIQSKKTQLIIARALKFFSKGLSSLIVLRNCTGDADQLTERIVDKLNELKAFLPPRFKDVVFQLVDNIISENLLNEGKPTITIAIGNRAPLEKYATILEENPILHKKMVLFEDEKDFIDAIGTQVRTQLDKIRSFSHSSFGISATIMDPLLERHIDSGNVFIMKRPEFYKGIENLERHNLPLPAKYSTKTSDDVFENDENFVKFFENFSSEPIGEEYISGIHKEKMPKIALFRVAKTINSNKKVLAYTNTNYPQIPGMFYSGMGVILSLPTVSSSIKLTDGVRSTVGPLLDDDDVELGGTYHFFKKTSPSRVLEWLYDNGGFEKFPRIVIFAGELAARSISFGASNFKWCQENEKLWWHANIMYFLVSKTMDEAEMMQTAGRLCGVFKDSVPQRLYALEQTHDDLNKAYWRQEELIERAKTTKNCRDMGVAIKDLPIFADKLTKRSMTKKTEYKLNKVKNAEEEIKVGGWDMDETYKTFDIDGNVMESIDVVFSDDEEEEEFSESKEDEFEGESKEDIKETKISIFNRKTTIGSIYTREEVLHILEECRYNQPSSMLSSMSNKSQTYGKYLLERLTDGRYKRLG